MSVRVRELLTAELGALRHEPLEKRIRADLGGRTVVDTVGALLVWEPRRIVPAYAVPEQDIDGALEPAPAGTVEVPPAPVLPPRIPFAMHTAPGETLVLRVGGREAGAFRPADQDLDGFVLLDFAGFDAWYEEDEPNVGHPRDPFHRIDIVHSSRHARVTLGDRVLADTRSPVLLFEPPLPLRAYVPVDDVALDLLTPSDHRTTCAYKGHASYWSLPDAPDVAWTYREPLREAAEITGLIAFFNERVDVTLDGIPLGRPVTEWSRG